jgi:hypothetical protein
MSVFSNSHCFLVEVKNCYMHTVYTAPLSHKKNQQGSNNTSHAVCIVYIQIQVINSKKHTMQSGIILDIYAYTVYSGRSDSLYGYL